MKAIACLLIALCVSSVFFGVCSGAVWFEGSDSGQPQEIELNMQRTTPAISSQRALPFCSLVLNETEPQTVELVIRVSTAAIYDLDGDIETWLSIDSQEPEKLVGTIDTTASAAGASYYNHYTVPLSWLRDGAHSVSIRITGICHGHSYNCEGTAAFVIYHEVLTVGITLVCLIVAGVALAAFYKRKHQMPVHKS
jgi:hypothetical protein